MIVISGTGIVVALVGVVHDCNHSGTRSGCLCNNQVQTRLDLIFAQATTPSAAAADAIFLASIHVFFTIEFLPALSI